MSKIKVDPRTFSIINQDKEIMPSGGMSITEDTASTDSSTDSDSDASNGFGSDSGSEPVMDQVKVIKLQPSEQFQIKQDQQGGAEKSALSSYLKTDQQKSIDKAGLSTYLKPSIINKFEDQTSSKIKQKNDEEYSNDENELTNQSEEVKNTNSEVSTEPVEPVEPAETNKPVEIFKHSESEVIDLSGDKLYEVLAMVLEDQKGDNISENLFKLNKTMEKHAEIMEKILNQLISMQNKTPNQSPTSPSIVIPKKLQEDEGMAGGKTLERMKDRK